MDANNLKYFVAVAKYGSINHAAKAMYISQPQLSHIIKSLEDETGLVMFQRTRHGTKLTRDGEKFLAHCEVILREMDNLKHFINVSREETSHLSVSMTRFSHTAECFNEICAKYQDRNRFSYKLREDGTSGVIDDIAEKLSNIGVIHFSTADADMILKNLKNKQIDFIQLATFRPYVCISGDHEIMQQLRQKSGDSTCGIEIEMLAGYGFVRYIGQYEDFIYHIATESGLVDLNESQKIVYVNDRQEQMRLISRTNFYTIGIVDFAGQNPLYNVVSVPLLHCSEHLTFGIITRSSSKLSDIENDFIDYVRNHYASLQMQDDRVSVPR
ncbi:MAG: LysR family transcriptional regulator [Lachnospiraceae bacterium]|nr:LysR family transcriptional regulator [Lachnospiraceae bacterium]